MEILEKEHQNPGSFREFRVHSAAELSDKEALTLYTEALAKFKQETINTDNSTSMYSQRLLVLS